MPLPDINLDDLRAQTLLDEARLKINTLSPEWTDYNVSDPGITLLELFAWKTEKLAYRLNRVPDKLLRRLMDLIGIDKLAPAVSAKIEVTFRLVTPFPLADKGDETYTDIPAGAQVATRRLDEDPEVVFTTRAPLRVGPLAIERVFFSGDVLNQHFPTTDYRVNFKSPFALFGERPQAGDAFCISFKPMVTEQTTAGHVVRLTFENLRQNSMSDGRRLQSTGTGYTAGNPPWVWEYLHGTEWMPLSLGNVVGGEADTTRGFNADKGAVTLYLPADMRPSKLDWDIRESCWVRCRHVPQEDNQVTESPRVSAIEAQVIGGAVLAENAVVVEGELLGVSDGRPGQNFTLRHAPVLSFESHASRDLDESVEVEQEGEQGRGIFERWTRVDDFGDSTAHSRHYLLDEVTGEVSFGPAVRLRDGTVQQHGRTPALGRRIRITRYRYSLGARGNVKADKVTVMKTAIPLVDRVHNREGSRGGQDVESMELARMRARRAMKTQDRAVTAEDYENLLLARFNALPDRGRRQGDTVARAKCLISTDEKGLPKGAVHIVILPGPFSPDASRRATLEADNTLCAEVSAFLDRYRLLTTEVVVTKAQFTEIDVRVVLPNIIDARLTRDALKARVTNVVARLFAPAVMMDTEKAAHLHQQAGVPLDDELFDEGWAGWPFGKTLEDGIVQATLMRLPAVRYVKSVDFRFAAGSEEKAESQDTLHEFKKTRALPMDGLPLLRACEVKFDG
jgi:predicted phage baseplate assembly protein